MKLCDLSAKSNANCREDSLANSKFRCNSSSVKVDKASLGLEANIEGGEMAKVGSMDRSTPGSVILVIWSSQTFRKLGHPQESDLSTRTR